MNKIFILAIAMLAFTCFTAGSPFCVLARMGNSSTNNDNLKFSKDSDNDTTRAFQKMVKDKAGPNADGMDKGVVVGDALLGLATDKSKYYTAVSNFKTLFEDPNTAWEDKRDAFQAYLVEKKKAGMPPLLDSDEKEEKFFQGLKAKADTEAQKNPSTSPPNKNADADGWEPAQGGGWSNAGIPGINGPIAQNAGAKIDVANILAPDAADLMPQKPQNVSLETELFVKALNEDKPFQKLVVLLQMIEAAGLNDGSSPEKMELHAGVLDLIDKRKNAIQKFTKLLADSSKLDALDVMGEYQAFVKGIKDQQGSDQKVGSSIPDADMTAEVKANTLKGPGRAELEEKINIAKGQQDQAFGNITAINNDITRISNDQRTKQIRLDEVRKQLGGAPAPNVTAAPNTEELNAANRELTALKERVRKIESGEDQSNHGDMGPNGYVIAPNGERMRYTEKIKKFNIAEIEQKIRTLQGGAATPDSAANAAVGPLRDEEKTLMADLAGLQTQLGNLESQKMDWLSKMNAAGSQLEKLNKELEIFKSQDQVANIIKSVVDQKDQKKERAVSDAPKTDLGLSQKARQDLDEMKADVEKVAQKVSDPTLKAQLNDLLATVQTEKNNVQSDTKIVQEFTNVMKQMAQQKTATVSPKEIPTGRMLTREVQKTITKEVPTGKMITKQVPTGKMLTRQVPTGITLKEVVPTGRMITKEVPTGKMLTRAVETGNMLTQDVIEPRLAGNSKSPQFEVNISTNNWAGFPLGDIYKSVEPPGDARQQLINILSTKSPGTKLNLVWDGNTGTLREKSPGEKLSAGTKLSFDLKPTKVGTRQVTETRTETYPEMTTVTEPEMEVRGVPEMRTETYPETREENVPETRTVSAVETVVEEYPEMTTVMEPVSDVSPAVTPAPAGNSAPAVTPAPGDITEKKQEMKGPDGKVFANYTEYWRGSTRVGSLTENLNHKDPDGKPLIQQIKIAYLEGGGPGDLKVETKWVYPGGGTFKNEPDQYLGNYPKPQPPAPTPAPAPTPDPVFTNPGRPAPVASSEPNTVFSNPGRPAPTPISTPTPPNGDENTGSPNTGGVLPGNTVDNAVADALLARLQKAVKEKTGLNVDFKAMVKDLGIDAAAIASNPMKVLALESTIRQMGQEIKGGKIEKSTLESFAAGLGVKSMDPAVATANALFAQYKNQGNSNPAINAVVQNTLNQFATARPDNNSNPNPTPTNGGPPDNRKEFGKPAPFDCTPGDMSGNSIQGSSVYLEDGSLKITMTVTRANTAPSTVTIIAEVKGGVHAVGPVDANALALGKQIIQVAANASTTTKDKDFWSKLGANFNSVQPQAQSAAPMPTSAMAFRSIDPQAVAASKAAASAENSGMQALANKYKAEAVIKNNSNATGGKPNVASLKQNAKKKQREIEAIETFRRQSEAEIDRVMQKVEMQKHPAQDDATSKKPERGEMKEGLRGER